MSLFNKWSSNCALLGCFIHAYGDVRKACGDRMHMSLGLLRRWYLPGCELLGRNRSERGGGGVPVRKIGETRCIWVQIKCFRVRGISSKEYLRLPFRWSLARVVGERPSPGLGLIPSCWLVAKKFLKGALYRMAQPAGVPHAFKHSAFDSVLRSSKLYSTRIKSAAQCKAGIGDVSYLILTANFFLTEDVWDTMFFNYNWT